MIEIVVEGRNVRCTGFLIDCCTKVHRYVHKLEVLGLGNKRYRQNMNFNNQQYRFHFIVVVVVFRNDIAS